MDETQGQLQALRTQIINELVPLAQQSDLKPQQKFAVILASARLSGEADKFNAAHEVAMQIESTSEKAAALLDLLEAIDEAGAPNAR